MYSKHDFTEVSKPPCFATCKVTNRQPIVSPSADHSTEPNQSNKDISPYAASKVKGREGTWQPDEDLPCCCSQSSSTTLAG